MEFASGLAIAAIVILNGFIISLKPASVDTNCKYKTEYSRLLQYCLTGDTTGLPPKIKQYECDASAINSLRNNINICR